MAHSVQFLKPDSLPKSAGYSQVAVAVGGPTVFIAGQVAIDSSGSLVGRNDFRAQAEQVFANLEAAVEAAGGTFRDIVKMNSYFLDMAHLPAFRDVRDKYIDLAAPPVSTAVQVAWLFRPEFLIEVEAVAIIG